MTERTTTASAGSHEAEPRHSGRSRDLDLVLGLRDSVIRARRRIVADVLATVSETLYDANDEEMTTSSESADLADETAVESRHKPRKQAFRRGIRRLAANFDEIAAHGTDS